MLSYIVYSEIEKIPHDAFEADKAIIEELRDHISISIYGDICYNFIWTIYENFQIGNLYFS